MPVLSSNSTVKAIGIGFPIGIDTGWRVYGLNLALQLLKLPGVEPVPLLPIATPHQLNPLHRQLLLPFMDHQRAIQPLLAQHPDRTVSGDLLVLKGLGNNFVMLDEVRRIIGKRNVGVIFFEDTHLMPQAVETAKQFDRIIAGSTWNAEVLKSYGLDNVVAAPQGIDPAIFHPAPKTGLLGDRFVIFSGGKLEYRKGQDIVVAAFRIFQQRHPEALLVTAWHNLWANTIQGIDLAGHVVGQPKIEKGRLQVTDWLVENGIPARAVLDVGAIPNYMAGQILREVDVAVFPNRAEGGTNLVAMECLACGIPTILSNNTGHQDLIAEAHCYPLKKQGNVRDISLFRGTAGWGESDVEEVVEALEKVYGDRPQAQQKSTAAVELMRSWTWEKQVKRLVSYLSDLL